MPGMPPRKGWFKHSNILQMKCPSILHSVGNYWVSNEGTKKDPSYHVWENGITHATADSAYEHLDLAICRSEYLARTDVKEPL